MKDMKRILFSVLALVCSMSAMMGQGFSNVPSGDDAGRQQNELESAINKLARSTLMINAFYVDSVDTRKLVEDAINGMLSKLDPHSAYTNAKETKKFTEPLEGSFESIGV